MHILEAYMAAFNMLDATIQLIRESADTETANVGLQELLGIDEIQAKAILDLKLQKLTGLEIDTLRQDHKDTALLIEDYKDILAHEGRVLSIIKDELNEMKAAYGDERRTIIDPNAIDTDEEDLIPEEDVVITISDDGYIKRIPLRTYRGIGSSTPAPLSCSSTPQRTEAETIFFPARSRSGIWAAISRWTMCSAPVPGPLQSVTRKTAGSPLPEMCWIPIASGRRCGICSNAALPTS